MAGQGGEQRIGFAVSFREGFRAWPHVWRRSLLVASCVGLLAGVARALGWMGALDELSLALIAFVATQGLIGIMFLLVLVLRALATRA